MGEEHLHFLSVAARLLIGGGLSNATGDVARRFVNMGVILRLGDFGQHLGLSGQERQSVTREKYETMLSPRALRFLFDLGAILPLGQT